MKCHAMTSLRQIQLPSMLYDWAVIPNNVYAMQVADTAIPWAAQATARMMTATRSMGMVHMCVPNTPTPASTLHLLIAPL